MNPWPARNRAARIAARSSRSPCRGAARANRRERPRVRPRTGRRPCGSRCSRKSQPHSRRVENLPPRRTTSLIYLRRRRAAYPKPSRTTSGSFRHRGSNPDVGFTVAGCYLALAFLVVTVFLIWQAAAQPPKARIGQIFMITVLFLHGTALLLSFAGSIWILVIAFGESLAQGLLCLLVPCYVLFYAISRWEDTKGAFALELLPVANIVAFFAIGLYINAGALGIGGDNMANGGAEPEAMPAPGEPPPGFGPPPGHSGLHRTLGNDRESGHGRAVRRPVSGRGEGEPVPGLATLSFGLRRI